jgi:hypothetical protein
MKPGIHYATIRGNYVLNDCSWIVRRYYSVYSYLGFQKEGGNGIYANTRIGVNERIGQYPTDVNDDTLSCWSFLPEEQAYVTESNIRVHVPKDFQGLKQCLSRSARRRYRLDNIIPRNISSKHRTSKLIIINRIIKKPELWLSFFLYLFIKRYTNRLGYSLFLRNETNWLSNRH